MKGQNGRNKRSQYCIDLIATKNGYSLIEGTEILNKVEQAIIDQQNKSQAIKAKNTLPNTQKIPNNVPKTNKSVQPLKPMSETASSILVSIENASKYLSQVNSTLSNGIARDPRINSKSKFEI